MLVASPDHAPNGGKSGGSSAGIPLGNAKLRVLILSALEARLEALECIRAAVSRQIGLQPRRGESLLWLLLSIWVVCSASAAAAAASARAWQQHGAL